MVYIPRTSLPQVTVKLKFLEEGLVIESVTSFYISFLFKASNIKYPAFFKSPSPDLLTISSFEKRESL